MIFLYAVGRRRDTLPNHLATTSKVCPNCDRSFLVNQVGPDGVRRNHRKRTHCFDCVPFGDFTARGLSRRSRTEKPCSRCGEVKPLSDFYKRSRGDHKSMCKSCHDKDGTSTRNDYKAEAVAYKGGKCRDCGYNRYLGALEFHHLDPSKKDFSIGALGYSFETAKPELDKCRLVCGNCHREEHQRLSDLAALKADRGFSTRVGRSAPAAGIARRPSRSP